MLENQHFFVCVFMHFSKFFKQSLENRAYDVLNFAAKNRKGINGLILLREN